MSFTLTLTIVLAEVCLALMIVLAVIGAKWLRRRHRDRAAVKTLVTRIKINRGARVEKLAGILKDTGQLNDDDALGKANDLIKKQNRFYQDAIDLYFTRNHEVLSKLDSRLEELLSQYQVMVTPGEGQASTMDNGKVEQLSTEIAALSHELEQLRVENIALRQQLKAAEHELDQLGQEYVSAFNKPKHPAARSESQDKVSPPSPEGSMPVEEVGVETMGDDAAAEPPPAAAEAAAMSQADIYQEEDKDKGILTDLDLAELLVEPTEAAKDFTKGA